MLNRFGNTLTYGNKCVDKFLEYSFQPELSKNTGPISGCHIFTYHSITMTGKGSAITNKKPPVKKNESVKFNMNGAVGVLLKKKLSNPETADLKPKALYDSEETFFNSGILLQQFRSAIGRIRVQLGNVVDGEESK